MNILLITSYYSPCIGGFETQVRQIAHELANNYQVDIIAGNFTAKTLPDNLSILHTNFLASSYPYNPLGQLFYLCDRHVYLHRLLQIMQGVDVVYSLARDYLGWVAQAAAQQLGIPFISSPLMHP